MSPASGPVRACSPSGIIISLASHVTARLHRTESGRDRRPGTAEAEHGLAGAPVGARARSFERPRCGRVSPRRGPCRAPRDGASRSRMLSYSKKAGKGRGISLRFGCCCPTNPSLVTRTRVQPSGRQTRIPTRFRIDQRLQRGQQLRVGVCRRRPPGHAPAHPARPRPQARSCPGAPSWYPRR